MAGGEDRPIVIPVRTPVEPKGLSFGMSRCGRWGSPSCPGRHAPVPVAGVNYEADRIEPVRQAAS
jgi:hypothetical protein